MLIIENALPEDPLPVSRILVANVLVVAVGMVDLITTVYWLTTGQIVEVNPIMAAVLELGMGTFIGIKLLTLASYFIVMEWYRRYRNPAMAQLIGHVTLIAYIGIYTISFCWVNHAAFL